MSLRNVIKSEIKFRLSGGGERKNVFSEIQDQKERERN